MDEVASINNSRSKGPLAASFDDDAADDDDILANLALLSPSHEENGLEVGMRRELI